MPATIETLDNTFVFRPTFTAAEKSISTKKKKERRFVPSALIPHTAQIVVESNICSIALDYTIDELKDGSQELSSEVSVILGKYTKKVVSITLSYQTVNELPQILQRAEKLVVALQVDDNRVSVNRNYNLVADLLNDIANKYETDPQFRELLSE